MNKMMNELFKCVLSLSLSGMLLIFLLLLCKPILKNRFNKRWQYYIWLIVIARLLVPLSLPQSPVGTLVMEADRAVYQMTVGTGEETALPVAAGENVSVNSGYQQDDTIANTETKSIVKIMEAVLQKLWTVWLAGMFVLIIQKLTAYHTFVRYVKNGCAEVSDTDLLNQLAKCGKQANVRRPIELYVNKLIPTPMLIGFLHPRIILPATDLTSSDFDYTFMHELVHYRRHDILYKWLAQFTVCVHWFNPMVWLMSREVDRACELACDEAVISRLEKEGQQAYGDMLLNAVKVGGDCRNSIASITLYESKKLIKERLSAIMNFKKKSKWVTICSIALAFVILVAAVSIGAYLMPSNKINAVETVEDSVHIESIDNNESMENNETIENSFQVIHDEGVYYILCNGVDESDISVYSGVTDGYVKFVFVRKDGYTTVGPFERSEMLLDEVNKQCEYMLEAQSISQTEATLLAMLSEDIQLRDVSVLIGQVVINTPDENQDRIEISTDVMPQSVRGIDIHSECTMLDVKQISEISNTVVNNVLETHAGIYSFDKINVMLSNEFEEDGNIVVDVEVGTIMTLIRNPEDSPFVRGMNAEIDKLKDTEERESANRILDEYLQSVNQYYNVPRDNETGFCYRVYVSPSSQYKYYHRTDTGSGPILSEMTEHETFEEIFTEESGREYMRDKLAKKF